jgi:lysine-N-methylase
MALTDTQITQNFSNAYRHHARPLLDRHPHLIENFLANHIFKYAYPFGRSQNGTDPAPPTHQHLTLVANLALTQTLLVGLAAHHRGDLVPDHVVRLIQSLSKAIEHRPASVAHLTQVLHDQELITPAAHAQLLHLG